MESRLEIVSSCPVVQARTDLNCLRNRVYHGAMDHYLDTYRDLQAALFSTVGTLDSILDGLDGVFKSAHEKCKCNHCNQFLNQKDNAKQSCSKKRPAEEAQDSNKKVAA